MVHMMISLIPFPLLPPPCFLHLTAKRLLTLKTYTLYLIQIPLRFPCIPFRSHYHTTTPPHRTQHTRLPALSITPTLKP
jgi:hypothetical protein